MRKDLPGPPAPSQDALDDAPDSFDKLPRTNRMEYPMILFEVVKMAVGVVQRQLEHHLRPDM